MVLFATGQPGVDTTTTEGRERAAADVQLQAALSLGDRPLIVLASEQSMAELPFWPEAQRQQAALSTLCSLVVVPGSGHAIHWDQPAVVTEAVRQVVTQARGHR
jgi:pimeloyl-ACP methyl ester carboxylesterase